MNKILIKSFFFLSLISTLMITSCEEDVFNDIAISAPQNLSMTIDVSTDESGVVTVKPQAEGANYFHIYYGDVSDETPEVIQAGNLGTNVYSEGTYTIKVVAFNLNGDSIEASQQITLAFTAPQNLVIDVSVDLVNTNVVTVSPTADFATMFDVYFGDVMDELPTSVMAGSNVLHTYNESGTYEIKVVAKSGSSTTIEETVMIDITVPAKQLALPIDFEDAEINYDFISFGNANITKISNPDKSGINTSNTVASFVKGAGAEVWAGGVIQLPAPIDFSTSDQFSIKVWSPKAGASVLLKLENATDDQIFFEKTTPTTTSNSWENLVFNMSAIDKSKQYHKIVVFMDFGVVGDGAEYFFDDILLGEGNGNNGGDDVIELPLDFESATLDYGFNNFGNAACTVINNPDASSINTSAKVAQFSKGGGAETWAGSFVTLSEPIDFSAGTTIELKSWSPKAGINILMKIENKDDGDIFHEVQVTNGDANTWETVSFDFSGADMSQTYQKIVIFYDFGTTGDGTDYYYDDILLK